MAGRPPLRTEPTSAPVWTPREGVGPDRPAALDGNVAWLVRSASAVPAGDEAWLSPGEAARASGLVVPARRQGWLLRRWAAKEALAAVFGPDLGPPCDVEIANRDDGSPEVRWRGEPLPVGASLTDRAGWAACALAPAGVLVGCDLELIEPRSAVFVADWFTRAEQRFVARSPNPALAANLVWSAKESALKVIGEGLRRPTRSVEVRMGRRADTAGFAPLLISLAEGGVLPGWWRRLGPYVLTLAVASPAPLPLPALLFLGGQIPA